MHRVAVELVHQVLAACGRSEIRSPSPIALADSCLRMTPVSEYGMDTRRVCDVRERVAVEDCTVVGKPAFNRAACSGVVRAKTEVRVQSARMAGVI